MAALRTLHDLFVHQLRDVYSAERQLVQALPRMAKSATSDELREALEAHLEETEEQVTRLDEIFEQLGVSSRGMKCKGMEGLIEEGKELLEEDVDEDVLDAGIIAAAQRIEHYEIAAYGTLCEYARNLGRDSALALLETTLDEEKAADGKLTDVAEGGINALATREDGEDDDERGTDDAMEGEAPSSGASQSGGAGRGGAAKKKAPSKRR